MGKLLQLFTLDPDLTQWFVHPCLFYEIHSFAKRGKFIAVMAEVGTPD